MSFQNIILLISLWHVTVYNGREHIKLLRLYLKNWMKNSHMANRY